MLPCNRGQPRVLIFSSDPFLGLGVAVIAIIVACGAFLLLVLILLFVAFRTGRWWAASLSATWASLTTNNYYLCRGLQEHLGRLFFFVAPNLRLTLKWLASLILLASSVSSRVCRKTSSDSKRARERKFKVYFSSKEESAKNNLNKNLQKAKFISWKIVKIINLKFILEILFFIFSLNRINILLVFI